MGSAYPFRKTSFVLLLALGSWFVDAGEPALSHASREQHMQRLTAALAEPELHFDLWIEQHGKGYAEDKTEYSKRRAIWLENAAYALSYNEKSRSRWLGLNGLADLSQEEFRSRYLGYDNAARLQRPAKPYAFKYANVDDAELPVSVDWRTKGAVSEVKNQAQCGSCWAFSTTGSVEGINAIFTGKLVSLSEQELVDCDRVQDKGCSGGLMDYAYEWIVANGGLDTEEDYPYKATDGECLKKKAKRRVVSIDGYEDVPANDEKALKKAAAHQPVSVAIEADQKAFQLYAGGVFADETCGTELDHGVLVVGYGVDPEQGEYYIVKNSWGPEWGDKGYIRMKTMVEAKEGLCGIAMAASYPTKTTPNPPEPGPEPDPSPAPDPSPSPKPGPVPTKCDGTAECPPATTCCCVNEIFDSCLQWGCCPMTKATCCDDHKHCCPALAPVCDTAHGRCLPGSGSLVGSVPWSEKIPATITRPVAQSSSDTSEGAEQPSLFDWVFKRYAGVKSSRPSAAEVK